MNSILLVCVGNICRSPMAEGVFKKEINQFLVASAGIGALIGHGADAKAQNLMQIKGIDISNHVARQIDKRMCQKFDLLLVMDKTQKSYIERRYEFSRGKVFRICDCINEDVPDPYKKDEEAFRQSLDLIEKGAAFWIERIKKINEKIGN